MAKKSKQESEFRVFFRSSPKRKVMVIGLDCADPELVFGDWLEDLPNIRRVVRAGVHGKLRSVTPPITVPALMCMMTSRDPGELGIYGFRNRSEYGYDKLSIANSASVHEETVWGILSREGKNSIIIGLPPTYPVKPIRGNLISLFLTPGSQSQFTYPNVLRSEVQRLVGDLHGRRRIHHGFWQFMDPRHVLYPGEGNPFREAVHEHYKYVDSLVGELLEFADKNTRVLIVSDHGTKRMEGAIALNEWLVQKDTLC